MTQPENMSPFDRLLAAGVIDETDSFNDEELGHIDGLSSEDVDKLVEDYEAFQAGDGDGPRPRVLPTRDPVEPDPPQD